MFSFFAGSFRGQILSSKIEYPFLKFNQEIRNSRISTTVLESLGYEGLLQSTRFLAFSREP